MTSPVSEFLQHYYPGLSLRAPLFYLWPVGIRFDLQNDSPSPDYEYFREVERRATLLFETVFLPTDPILVLYQQWRGKRFRIKHSNYLLRQLQRSKNQLFFQRIGNPYPKHFQPGHWQRVSTTTTAAQLPYAAILRAISHQDFCSRKHLSTLHGETYFFNQRTGLLFHMYDDRGVDVLGPTAASLHPLYETFNHWILDYDRPRIITLFGA